MKTILSDVTALPPQTLEKGELHFDPRGDHQEFFNNSILKINYVPTSRLIDSTCGFFFCMAVFQRMVDFVKTGWKMCNVDDNHEEAELKF